MNRYLIILTYYNYNKLHKVYKVKKAKYSHELIHNQKKSDTLIQIEVLRYIGKNDTKDLIINEWLKSNEYDVNETFFTAALWNDNDGEWYSSNM